MLSQIGEKCKQILELWRLSYSMEEIAEKVGLGQCWYSTKTEIQLLPEINQVGRADFNFEKLSKTFIR